MTNNEAINAWMRGNGWEWIEYFDGNSYGYWLKDEVICSQDLAAEMWRMSEARAREARYMGAADFAQWIIAHDESSFRQERAWFKIKPQLLLKYQAELMEGLNRIHTNAGLDPEAEVRQLAHQPKETK